MISRAAWALAALLSLTLLVYESVTYGWAMGATVVVFLLLPDIALIGGFDPVRPGRLRVSHIPLYNALHRPWAGLALLLLGALVTLPAIGGVEGGKLIAAAGLAWIAHIAVDRAVGYGLRDAEGAVRGSHGPTPCRA
ncbi:DUF4260 family protein [Microbacterium soli]|uniref:DUF4260 family protein n=1 Tax=Microbacterium soli TaxID=446075 RepID=A0ABP7MU42_9MICO